MERGFGSSSAGDPPAARRNDSQKAFLRERQGA